MAATGPMPLILVRSSPSPAGALNSGLAAASAFAGAFSAFGSAAFFGASSFASSFGAASFWAAAFFDGLAPPVRISAIRTIVRCWRWPRLRLEFWRRRFLKAMTLRARPCSTTSAVTMAPSTKGAPIAAPAPSPTMSTSLNSTMSPASPASFSTVNRSLAATRYCLPPVLMTANIFCLSRSFRLFRSIRQRRVVEGRLLVQSGSSGSSGTAFRRTSVLPVGCDGRMPSARHFRAKRAPPRDLRGLRSRPENVNMAPADSASLHPCASRHHSL